MKKAIIVITIAFLALFAISPVLAIGPEQAIEVGNNPNLIHLGPTVTNTKGEAGGSNTWHWAVQGQYWGRMKYLDASQVTGLMNNAIIPSIPTSVSTLPQLASYILTLGARELDNQWIYLSGDGGSNPCQFNGHGLVYWISYLGTQGTAAQKAAAASAIVAMYPDGEFWMHNDVPATGP